MALPVCKFGGQDGEHCNHNIVLDNFTFNGRRLRPEEFVIQKDAFSDITAK